MNEMNEEFVVLQDEQGGYYLLPKQSVEQGRVTPESADAVRALLEEDVAGHLLPATNFLSARSIIVVGGYSSLARRGIIIVGG